MLTSWAPTQIQRHTSDRWEVDYHRERYRERKGKERKMNWKENAQIKKELSSGAQRKLRKVRTAARAWKPALAFSLHSWHFLSRGECNRKEKKIFINFLCLSDIMSWFVWFVFPSVLLSISFINDYELTIHNWRLIYWRTNILSTYFFVTVATLYQEESVKVFNQFTLVESKWIVSMLGAISKELKLFFKK